MPATLLASPGTAVRAAVLWVSPAQLSRLTWTETSYRLGRVAPVRFVCDQGTAAPEVLFAYGSRWGLFCPDGEPVALAAVEASRRRAPALSQHELLGGAARLGLDPRAGAEALVRLVLEDPAGFLAGPSVRIRAASLPFTSPAWTAYPDPFGTS